LPLIWPEAAHITPYLGGLTNHVSNGLLLRADLLTLFDCGLLAVEPKTRTVVVAEALKASAYAKLSGKVLRPTKEAACAPSRRNLEKRYGLFEAMNKRSQTASKSVSGQTSIRTLTE
jgi:putative restriction endonuclease